MVRNPNGPPKRGIKYSYLVLELERITGIDRAIVKQVLYAMPEAILAMFDRGDRDVQIEGFLKFRYCYRAGEKNTKGVKNLSRWTFASYAFQGFNEKLRQLLGRPEKFEMSYEESLQQRRRIISQRYDSMGLGEPDFNEKNTVKIPARSWEKAKRKAASTPAQPASPTPARDLSHPLPPAQ